MSLPETRYLDSFPAWLKTLGDDARALGAVLASSEVESVRLAVASALTYLFKSLDLIPDGLEDLGYMDDAFVLRVAAAGIPDSERVGEELAIVQRLAAEVALIQEFLGEDYARLAGYVAGLASGSARGRSVEQIVADAELRADFVRDVEAWANAYAGPGFGRDTKNLVKLLSFLKTKLP
jgi:uncharacterized membrane protein YkvA (DUF1232 family)